MRIWLGRESLELNRTRDVTLNALNHYKDRLSNIESDKQIEDLPKAVRSLLAKEAKKPFEVIDDSISKLETGGLNDISSLEERIDLLVKALECYRDDLMKTKRIMGDKYPELFDPSRDIRKEIELITEALEEIPKFSDMG